MEYEVFQTNQQNTLNKYRNRNYLKKKNLILLFNYSIELIPCSKHNTSKICLINFCDEKVQLICEQCLDGDVKDKGFQLNQILSIKKILMQPIYILTKLDWSNDLIQDSQDLASENKEQILQQINQLELQIKQFQEQISNISKNFKVYADKLQELKQQLISDMPKVLIFNIDFGLRLIQNNFIMTLRIQRGYKP